MRTVFVICLLFMSLIGTNSRVYANNKEANVVQHELTVKDNDLNLNHLIKPLADIDLRSDLPSFLKDGFLLEYWQW